MANDGIGFLAALSVKVSVLEPGFGLRFRVKGSGFIFRVGGGVGGGLE